MVGVDLGTPYVLMAHKVHQMTFRYARLAPKRELAAVVELAGLAGIPHSELSTGTWISTSTLGSVDSVLVEVAESNSYLPDVEHEGP